MPPAASQRALFSKRWSFGPRRPPPIDGSFQQKYATLRLVTGLYPPSRCLFSVVRLLASPAENRENRGGRTASQSRGATPAAGLETGGEKCPSPPTRVLVTGLPRGVGDRSL